MITKARGFKDNPPHVLEFSRRSVITTAQFSVPLDVLAFFRSAALGD